MGTEFVIDEETAFYGRTFHEYRRMFDLTRSELDGASVLDCPGGPGSFAAVASALTDEVVAVDPRYGPPATTLEERCRERIEKTERQLREKRDAFVWDVYDDPGTRTAFVRAAATRFLWDYQRRPDRYVAAALPDLPFERDAFDLAVSGNLLFLYGDRFDRSFHVAALRELARVAAEVRAFPLANLAAERSEHVAPVARTLREDGYDVELRSVPYEFQPDVTEMLVVTDGR